MRRARSHQAKLILQVLLDAPEVPQTILDASLEFVNESLTWRLETYRPSVPPWALGLLPHADAYRYNLEWSAHLRELVDNSEMSQVRADRLRLVMIAICFAVVLRVRRVCRFFG